MRKLLLAFLLVAVASSFAQAEQDFMYFKKKAGAAEGGDNPITVDNVAMAGSNGATLSVTIPSTTSGSMIVVMTGNETTGPLAVTDDKGGGSSTYVLAAGGYNTTDSRNWAGIYYVENCAAGITSVSVASNYNETKLIVLTISGAATSGALDNAVHNFQAYNAGDNWSTGTTSATSQANEIVVSYTHQTHLQTNVTWTGTAGWIGFWNTATFPDRGFGQYKILSSTGAQTASGTFVGTGADHNYSSVIATFKAQ
ncbi:MAG: hypothetical protein WCV62_05660 [Candidatus Peribacteraceae bacterium]|jgi:hypothetical protein